MNLVIEAKGVRKKYEQLEVLKGIDLEIKEQEVVSIVGASGAGKTTLLQILGTLEKPDQGQIRYGTKDIFTLKDREISRFRNNSIGFIFQFHQLLPEFTALENVCIPAFIGKKNKKESIKKGEELLQMLGLKDRMHHKPNQMSGGEQQRAAVARALINNPMVVFADEPSGNLDSANAEQLHKLFFDLRDRLGQTFVIVTHNKQLASMADRSINIVDGRISNS